MEVKNLNKEIIELFTKYYHDFCSQQELDKVVELLRNGKYHDEWKAVLKMEAAEALKGGNEAGISEEEMESLNERIRQTVNERARHTIKLFSTKLWLRLGSVAAIVSLVGVGIYFYSTLHLSDKEPINLADITLPRTGAMLTLSNGEEIQLSVAANGKLAEEDGTEIIKNAREQLVYTNRNLKHRITKTNFLATARGHVYQVTLPDGTNVWLNAATKLKYPTSFSGGKDRRVWLSGEAYFEVKKNKQQPFMVESKGQQVKVLGTKFNIKSYANETVVKTTLLEGSVSVNQNTILKPGEQAVFSDKGNLKVSPVDTQSAVAWKNNEFIFDGESIDEIMNTISRWYDVEVVYIGARPAQKFIGSISRLHPLAKTLKLLATTGNISFRVEGNTIHVSKSKAHEK